MGNQKDHWLQAISNKCGRLAHGNNHGIVPTDTIDFIPYDQVPCGQEVIYASFVCNYFPLKAKEWQVCWGVKCDYLTYHDDPSFITELFPETKLMVSSNISGLNFGARLLSADLKDYFWHHQWINQNI